MPLTGIQFEQLFKPFLESIFKKMDYKSVVVRNQKSGTQYGFDIRVTFTDKEGNKKRLFVECKYYDSKLNWISLFEKQVQLASSNHRPDGFLIISPKQIISNIDDDLQAKAEREWFKFPVALWTPDEGVNELFSLDPSFYEKIYGEKCGVVNEQEVLERAKKFIESLLVKKSALPEKIKYEEQKGYITRSLRKANKQLSIIDSDHENLAELVKKKKKITVLGVAGYGKSIELEQLAYEHSNPNSPFFPIKIRLNRYTKHDSIKQLLRNEYSEFDKIKSLNLLIILDALDEVPPELISEAVKSIANLADELVNSHIVVSCRNNFYTVENLNRSARIEGFETYYINPISYPDIYNYSNKNLGDRAAQFMEEVRHKGLIDQLTSPFYLVHTVEYFKSKGELNSNRASLFEFLISQRIQRDNEDKYINSGLNLEENETRIRKEIEKLAISTQLLGRNFLKKKEYKELVFDVELKTLVDHQLLFDKNEQDEWEFEHNNFQEYLAAKYLSNLSLNRIKEFMSFYPSYDKIKPNWVNTLSNLFNVLDPKEVTFKALMRWVVSVEPELLIRFERDKTNLKIREKIFRAIFNEYEKKDIPLKGDNFNIYELFGFVSDSKKTIRFIFKKIKPHLFQKAIDLILRRKPINEERLQELVSMMPSFKYAAEYKNRIEEILIPIICNQNIKFITKFICLETLGRLRIYSDNITERLLENNNFNSDSQYLRAGFYTYLVNAPTNELNKHIPLIINGIVQVRGVSVKRESEEGPFSEEWLYLEDLFENHGTPELIDEALKVDNIPEEYRNSHTCTGILVKIIGRASFLSSNHSGDFYTRIFDLYGTYSKLYEHNVVDACIEFFTKTGNRLRAFKGLLLKSQWLKHFEHYDALAKLGDESCVEYVIQEFREGHSLSDNQIYSIRGMFGQYKKTLQDTFHKEINEMSDGRYPYPEIIDHDKLRTNRGLKDIALLMDRELFIDALNKVFEQSGNEVFTQLDYQKYRDQEIKGHSYHYGLITSTLDKLTRNNESIPKQHILELYKIEKDWIWFQIHKVLEIDDRNKNLELSQESRLYLSNWLKWALEEANFSTVFSDSTSYRYLEHYIIYIIYRLRIEVEESVYLDALCLHTREFHRFRNKKGGEPSPHNLYEFIIKKVGLEKAKRQIISNVEGNKLVGHDPQYNHCKFCYNNNMPEGVSLFEKLLDDTTFRGNKPELFQWYLELGGNAKFVEDRLEMIDDEWSRFYALEALLKQSSKWAMEHCRLKCKNSEEVNLKFKYVSLLSTFDMKEAFSILKDWVIENHQIPINLDRRGLTIYSEEIDEYVDMFESAVVYNYKQGKPFDGTHILHRLTYLGSRNEDDYDNVRSWFNKWLMKYPDLKYFHYQLQKLETSYFTSRSQSIDFEEVKRLVLA